MELSVINSALSTVAKLVNQVRAVSNYQSDKSLADITRLTRVEPLTIVSADCANIPELNDVLNSNLSIFTAHYLQAMNILANVRSAEVVRALDRLNPHRDATGFLLGETLATESAGFSIDAYRHSLPLPGVRYALEAGDKDARLSEAVNLSIGRLVDVKIGIPAKGEDGKESSFTLPVQIRLLASIIPNGSVERLLAHTTEDDSFVERFHAWRSGRINLIGDLIFAQDLIDAQKVALHEDKTHTLADILKRVNDNRKFGLLARNPSLASSSNIFVISEQGQRDIEAKLGGRLDEPRIIKKAFENTYAIIISVINRDTNRVVFYTRNSSEPTELSFKALKTSSQKGGPDLLDMMKAFNLGMPASF